ncbi:hypothetical protein [Klebsiella pneumoniae]
MFDRVLIDPRLIKRALEARRNGIDPRASIALYLGMTGKIRLERISPA